MSFASDNREDGPAVVIERIDRSIRSLEITEPGATSRSYLPDKGNKPHTAALTIEGRLFVGRAETGAEAMGEALRSYLNWRRTR